MKNFLRTVFGSCLGVLLAILVIGLIATLVGGSLMSKSSSKPSLSSNSVLKLDFKKLIPERTDNTVQGQDFLNEEKNLGLFEIVNTIEHAKDDKKIKGILLDLGFNSFGNAKAEAIRNALVDFKESGKFIYAYANRYGYGQGAYYLATTADQIWLHPLGAVDFRGFGMEMPFFKDLLDKVGVKMQPFYAGKFKSATEPFRRNDMSEENRKQVRAYVSEMWEDFLGDIAASRDLTVEELRDAAANVEGRLPAKALAAGLVDELLYEDQVFDELRTALDLDKDDKINFTSLENYNEVKGKDLNLSAPSKIAILYAEGQIRRGTETYGTITDEHYVEMLRKIRKDDKVDALVLRVNSGGGDAIVSDMIWREIELLKEKGVKVVASFADVAASGGYYIACGADKILAEPNTITGSIGVFGMAPNVQELFNEKLGIHMDTVKTLPYATGILSPFYPVGPEQARLIQEGVDHTYEVFLSRVAEGRNMTRDQVHEIAQGRVWTGRKALENGLIDELGDIKSAVAQAADLADVDDYRITEYPRIKDPITLLLEELTGQKTSSSWYNAAMQRRFPEATEMLETLEYILSTDQPQARLPFYFQSL